MRDYRVLILTYFIEKYTFSSLFAFFSASEYTVIIIIINIIQFIRQAKINTFVYLIISITLYYITFYFIL